MSDIENEIIRLKEKHDNIDQVVNRYFRIKRKKFIKRVAKVISFNYVK